MKAIRVVLDAEVPGLGVPHHRPLVSVERAKKLFAMGLAHPYEKPKPKAKKERPGKSQPEAAPEETPEAETPVEVPEPPDDLFDDDQE